MDIEQTAITIRDAIRDLPKQFEGNAEKIAQLEKEQTDFLHLIELTDLNAYEGFKAYKEIQRVQRERRILKDENEQLKHLYPALQGLKGQLNRFDKSVKEIRKTKEYFTKRTYRCRARTDLENIINGVKQHET